MNITILLALFVAFACVFALKSMVSRMLKRHVVNQAFTLIGQKSLTRMQQTITLTLDNYPEWTHGADVERQAAPLRGEGFTDLGAYSVNTTPPLMIRLLYQPTTYVAAHIYDHAKSGSWIEFVTRYTDGSKDTLSTRAAVGLDKPDWVRRIQADKSTPTEHLYRQFLTLRAWHGIKHVAPEDLVREFEEDYKKYMMWRQEHGISPEEVAKVATRWAKKRAAATNQ